MLKRWIVLGLFSLMLLGVANAFAIIVPCPNNKDYDSSMDLRNALWAAKDGGTVRLEAGTYYLHNTLVVDFTFRGMLKGAGKGRTIITADPDHKISPILSTEWPGDPSPIGILIWFNIPVDSWGDINVSDLSVIVPYADPCSYLEGVGTGFGQFFLINGNKVNTRFERVQLKGGPGDWWGAPYNTWAAFQIFGSADHATEQYRHLEGDHIFSDCDFDTFLYVCESWPLKNGKIRFINNRLQNCGMGISITPYSNCNLEFLWNQFTEMKYMHAIDVEGDFGIDDPESLPSRVTITNNDIQTSKLDANWVDGIWLWDHDGTNKMLKDVYVAFNSITGDNAAPGYMWNGIGAIFLDKANLLMNRIAGAGGMGIQVYGTTNTRLVGNNVGKFTAVPIPFWGEPQPTFAPIWLAENTNHCTVIGANLDDFVVDKGTDNRLIGINFHPWREIRPDLHELLQKKMEMRRHHHPMCR